MLSWQELKQRPEIVGAIDWEITPAQAFEAFQIKSTTAQRGLGTVYYFYLSTWRGENQVLLVERSLLSWLEVCCKTLVWMVMLFHFLLLLLVILLHWP